MALLPSIKDRPYQGRISMASIIAINGRSTTALFLSALLLLLLVACAGCVDDPPPIVAEFVAESDGPVETVLNPDGSDPNAFNKDGTPMTRDQQVETLIGVAGMLESRHQQVSVGQMLIDQKEMVKISDRLFKFKLDDLNLAMAFRIKITALIRLHSTSDRKAREQLIDLIAEFKDNKNLEIRRFCQSGEINLKTQDYLRLDTSEFTPLRDTIETATAEFPDSEQIANECLSVIVQLLSRQKREQSVEVMKIMQKNFAKSTEPKVIAIANSLGDKIFLANIRFDQIVGNLQSGLEGAQQKYVQAGREMARLDTMGPSVYTEVINVSRWLEQNGNTNAAIELLDTLNETLKTTDKSDMKKGARQAVARIKTRSALLGKPLTIAGRNRDADEFENEVLNGKVTMVYFWSTTKPQSVQPLASFLPLYASYQERGLEIVTYCIDTNPENAITLFGSNPPPWQNLFYNEKNKDHKEMLRNSGVQFLPYVVLLDRDRKVTDINVPFGLIQPKLEALLGPKPDSGSATDTPPSDETKDSSDKDENSKSNQ